MEIWSTQLHVFLISTPSGLLHYREISCVLNITNHKWKDDHYLIWMCRIKNRKIKSQLMSYHGPEEMPISKVHVHFLLELIKVALRQNPTVHVGLQRQNLTKTLWHSKNSLQTLDQFDLSSMLGVETKFTVEMFKYAGWWDTAGRLTNGCLMETSEMSLLPSDVVQWKERLHCETSVCTTWSW